ncbi:MAG: NifU family protein [Spirochaetaceae bacterium]|jgi:Fe/S biogenesis protein NfuA|nr:NifU family protein [Spirochaetaceae bacterium]
MTDLDNIAQFLDTQIRPLTKAHGGDVAVENFDGTVLRLKMLGGCNGCPSAVFEIEELCREGLPDIKVVVDTGVSDELIEQARRMLNHE